MCVTGDYIKLHNIGLVGGGIRLLGGGFRWIIGGGFSGGFIFVCSTYTHAAQKAHSLLIGNISAQKIYPHKTHYS